MDIRGQRTWCDKCTAPVVLPENVPLIELFIEALPAYHGGQGLFGSSVTEGFDRASVLALMELRGVLSEEHPEAWRALSEMEAEYRTIRAERAERTPKRKAT